VNRFIASAGATAALAALLGSTSAPLLAQSLTFTQTGSILGPADLVEIHDGRVFIVSGRTISLHDISDPAKPAALGSYEFPEKIWGIRVVGTLVYVAADFFGLGILDVSEPKKPVLRGSVKTPGQAKNVAVWGGTALVADHMSGLDIIDVSDASKPTTKGEFFLEGYARDVTANGPMAYAIDAPAGLYVFDLSKPGPVEPITSQQSATAPGSIELSSSAAPGGKGPQVAALVGGGSLQSYDISKPTAPVRLTAFKTASGRPLRATLSGQRAYVADGREGLQVVDLSQPASPKLVGGFKTERPARDVAVAGSTVLVVVGAPSETPREFKDGEVLILRQNP
jgi:hypothetical protein